MQKWAIVLLFVLSNDDQCVLCIVKITGMKELIQVFTRLDNRHKQRLKEMERLYPALQRKYNNVVELMKSKVDLWFHQYQMESAAKMNKNEIQVQVDEISDLKSRSVHLFIRY